MEPVKPVSRASKNAQAKVAQNEKKQQNSEKVKIGGVLFNRNQIDESKTKTYTQNGQKMNTVFVKPGVQIDYPDQKNKKNNPSVESRGLREEWYNPDSSWIDITDLENATVTGAQNRDDTITLKGNSNNNTIIVDNKESWYVDKSMRSDSVVLNDTTHDNTVKMDETDSLEIWYNPEVGSVIHNGVEHRMPHTVFVEGKGTSEQEIQLQESLGKHAYNIHKIVQKHDNEK